MKQTNIIKNQMKFLDCLYDSLAASMEKFVSGYYAAGSKNHSPTAIKRKITLLRQELLNLEKMMDGDASD